MGHSLLGTAPERGDRVKTQPLPQHAKAKQKQPSTSPLRGGDQGWCRNRYADGEAGSLGLLHQIAVNLAVELLAV